MPKSYNKQFKQRLRELKIIKNENKRFNAQQENLQMDNLVQISTFRLSKLRHGQSLQQFFQPDSNEVETQQQQISNQNKTICNQQQALHEKYREKYIKNYKQMDKEERDLINFFQNDGTRPEEIYRIMMIRQIINQKIEQDIHEEKMKQIENLKNIKKQQSINIDQWQDIPLSKNYEKEKNLPTINSTKKQSQKNNAFENLYKKEQENSPRKQEFWKNPENYPQCDQIKSIQNLELYRIRNIHKNESEYKNQFYSNIFHKQNEIPGIMIQTTPSLTQENRIQKIQSNKLRTQLSNPSLREEKSPIKSIKHKHQIEQIYDKYQSENNEKEKFQELKIYDDIPDHFFSDYRKGGYNVFKALDAKEWKNIY